MLEFEVATFVRMGTAMLLGGLLGLERERKHRPAGFRTYMLVCAGAALTVLLSQYVYLMLQTQWAEQAAAIGAVKMDVSRLAAQVINGIGFLGAGTILVTQRHEVQGLTTAAGLWSTACLGIAIGAGFYQAVLVAFLLMAVSVMSDAILQDYGADAIRNVELYVEYENVSDLRGIIATLKNLLVQIYDVEMNNGAEQKLQGPNVVLTVRYPEYMRHERVMASVAEVPGVRVVEEL